MSTTNTTNSTAPTSPSSAKEDQPLNVLFLHLDLGIGGAEQLVLQLATASQELGHQVTLLTTRCDADHCFSVVKKPQGPLSDNVQVWGRWIPPNFLGVGTALCSNLRVLYLAACLCWQEQPDQATPYLVVLDVLPTPLWLLQYFTNASLLFYCHFPDKLLIRNPNNNNNSNGVQRKSIYRRAMDALEEACMPLADSLLVNSKFTKQTVLKEFPSLSELQVLYPALDTKALPKIKDPDLDDNGDPLHASVKKVTIVSLNRYERKKKIELVLQAYSLLRVQYPPNTLHVIIAGGYDTKNVENVEYRGELEQLAFKELKLSKEEVQFKNSISDAERAFLLQTARCVVYTPANEHFGIVPLEVMYAGTPVIACNSGGPLETIVDGETGFLCDPTPQAFANAINILLASPKEAKEMGRVGREHVETNFGTERLTREWKRLTAQAFRRGQRRVRHRTYKPLGFRLVVYLTEAVLLLLMCWVMTIGLRLAGVVDAEESILGSMRRRLGSEEL